MPRGKVAVLKTTPESVLEDYIRLMELADYREDLAPDTDTLLKVNISWHTWYPACSTTPWQYEGVIQALLQAGYDKSQLIPAHNRTVVVNDKVGMVNNKFTVVDEKYGLKPVHLYEPPVEWKVFEPSRPFLVLSQVYPDGVKIPMFFKGKNIVHLPTTKTHVFTQTTGAMKNAFGGLLSERRHWTHAVIHETLVDLLMIQQEIHAGIFAVMDGTIAGDGPGPRAMVPHVKDYILASGDQVAIDAIAAKMMGFDPMKIKYIRLAHEMGLGVGNPSEIEVVGEDISDVNYGFVQTDTFASKGQKAIYHGFLKPFEALLLRSPIVPWSYAASRIYHDLYWYPFVGKKRVKEMLQTKWGRLFQSY
jgi:uncharacterized protein (DUF362 family)